VAVRPDVERVTVTVRSSLGEDGPLSVHDGLLQVLDFFDLLSMAQGTHQEGRAVSWELVSISKNSPLVAVAEAVSIVPGIAPGPIARRAKMLLAAGLSSVASGEEAPEWMDKVARERTRAIFIRNLDGIGRTDVGFGGEIPTTMIVERSARIGLLTLDRADINAAAREVDLSRTEIGSIEADISDATTYYGRPAIRARERLTGAPVLCVLQEKLADQLGIEHNWREVWVGARVLVMGEIIYRKDGMVSRVNVSDLLPINSPSVTYSELAQPDFTRGLTPTRYLEELWSGDVA